MEARSRTALEEGKRAGRREGRDEVERQIAKQNEIIAAYKKDYEDISVKLAACRQENEGLSKWKKRTATEVEDLRE